MIFCSAEAGDFWLSLKERCKFLVSHVNISDVQIFALCFLICLAFFVPQCTTFSQNK